MSNADVFIYPGEAVFLFILSVLPIHPASVDPGLYWMGSFFCAIVAWAFIISAISAVIKKLLGFEQRGR